MPGAGHLAGARVSMASYVNRKTWTPAFAGVTSEYGNRLRGPQSHALTPEKIERHPHPIPPHQGGGGILVPHKKGAGGCRPRVSLCSQSFCVAYLLACQQAVQRRLRVGADR